MKKWLDSDAFVLGQAVITKDRLAVTVSYRGDCEHHTFKLVAPPMVLESAPPQIGLILTHDANNDSCETWVSKDYSFDLTPIKELYQKWYH